MRASPTRRLGSARTWAEHARRAERRFADGQRRLPSEPEARQKQLGADGDGGEHGRLACLMDGRSDEAGEWFLTSAETYRASWRPPARELGPPDRCTQGGHPRPRHDRRRRDRDLGGVARGRAGGFPDCSLRRLRSRLRPRHDAEAARLAEGLGEDSTFPKPTAAALAALAHREPARYREAVAAVLVEFESRTDFLEDLPVADTVLVLEALAERRGLAVRPVSELLPPTA